MSGHTVPIDQASDAQAGHTPGPWLLVANTVYALQQDGWRKGEPLMVNRFSAVIQGGTPRPDEAELGANARLIAAAPELLEALQDMVDRYGYDGTAEDQRYEERARAAIAKALGEPAPVQGEAK